MSWRARGLHAMLAIAICAQGGLLAMVLWQSDWDVLVQGGNLRFGLIAGVKVGIGFGALQLVFPRAWLHLVESVVSLVVVYAHLAALASV